MATDTVDELRRAAVTARLPLLHYGVSSYNYLRRTRKMNQENNLPARLILIIATILLPSKLFGQQQDAVPSESAAARHLAQGTVHEALISASGIPSQTKIVLQPLPDDVPVIERPAQRGSDSVWVEGYWNWISDSRQFAWIPGFWRRAPENLRWQAGSWIPAPDGVVRHPGYWYDANRPPQRMHRAPPDDQGREATKGMVGDGNVWIRGSWIVNNERKYEWEPGYVARQETGYQWQPSTVLPAADGFAVVEGYWDFPLSERGTVFAAMQPPIPTTAGLRAIDPLSIQRAPDGTWRYSRLLQGSITTGKTFPLSTAPPSRPPHVSQQGLLVDGKASLSGIVRKGKLTPPRIEVKLVGGTARVTETDDKGRFQFTEIPYGRYSILAEGPVQNYHRSGAAFIDIEQPTTAQVEIELE